MCLFKGKIAKLCPEFIAKGRFMNIGPSFFYITLHSDGWMKKYMSLTRSHCKESQVKISLFSQDALG